VNIIYAGDIFRDSSRHAEVFFHQLIETPIKIALGIDPNSPPFRDLRIRDNRFDPATFLELSQATGWVKTYFSIPSAAEEYFFRSIPSDSVIIGYEMPPLLLTSLVRRAFRYIDFRISSIRFSRDMYVALESNLAIFGTAMNEFAVAQE